MSTEHASNLTEILEEQGLKMGKEKCRVQDALNLGKYTVLSFDETPYSTGHIKINSQVCPTLIVYDLPNSIVVEAVLDVKDLIGQEVEFI